VVIAPRRSPRTSRSRASISSAWARRTDRSPAANDAEAGFGHTGRRGEVASFELQQGDGASRGEREVVAIEPESCRRLHGAAGDFAGFGQRAFEQGDLAGHPMAEQFACCRWRYGIGCEGIGSQSGPDEGVAVQRSRFQAEEPLVEARAWRVGDSRK
jgi:hypothetical protein